MAANQSATVSVKILVDEKKSRVVCAEAGNDFVDILFSFLTLPMGTIVRLLRQSEIGCLNNLYQSVQNLSSSYFWTDACKEMLLHPRNPCEAFCRDLKVNIDDTEPTKYFMCPDFACFGSNPLLSNYANARCSRCGKLMNREILESDSSTGPTEVFVKESTNYIVSDDLKLIMPSTQVAVVKLLGNVGIKDVNVLEERTLEVGLKEISDLLERSLLSKCPLTDVFLPNQRLNSKNISFEPIDNHQLLSEQVTNWSMGVKILVRKSNRKALCAEAAEDFVDFLLSFLTIPLANVVKCLAGNSSLGCIDNLYRSVRSLNDKWFVTHKEPGNDCIQLSSKSLLLGPGLAQKFSCSNPPFNLCDETCVYPNPHINRKGDVCSLEFQFRCYYHGDHIKTYDVNLIDPKSPKGETSFAEFVKRPAVFQVSDGLAVLPSSGTTSSVSLVKGLRVPIHDIEEHEIQISKQQALNLLKASLISTSALTNALNNLLAKKPKQDSFEL